MNMRLVRFLFLIASTLVCVGWAGSPSSNHTPLLFAQPSASLLQPDQIKVPLYDGLRWHNRGDKLESVNINKELPLLVPGTHYQSDAINVKLPGEVVSFYSPDALSQLGWVHVSDAAGVLSMVSTYYKSPNTYLTVRFSDCTSSNQVSNDQASDANSYCINVWVSQANASVEAPVIIPDQAASRPDVSPNTNITIQYANPLPVPLFSQNDSTWKADRQGFPDAGYPSACDFCTLGYIDANHTGYGCWVASYAMLYNYYSPNFINPRDLNTKLNTGPGNGPRYGSNGAHCNNLMPGGSPYAPSGVARGSGTYNNCAQANCIDTANVTLIDNEINAGRPLLAFVHYSGTKPQHMVVITGHSGNTYYINDPWFGQRLTLATGALGPYIVDWLYKWNGTPPSGQGRLQIRNVSYSPTQVTAGNLLEVRVDVINSGDAPISVMGPDSSTYDENGGGWRNSECGKWRVGIDFDGRPSNMMDHPYRFGRDETLAPGESRIYGGYIRLATPRSADFWAGVVQECNHWEQDGSGRARITVVGGQGRLQIRNVSYSPTQVTAGNLLEVRVDVINSGDAPISVMGPDSSTYDENGGGWRNSECGKWRVGIDFDGRPSNMMDHPYRFGRDETLAPGESRIYGGYIRLATPRSADFWAGVVQECNHWEQDGSGRARITVQPNSNTVFASGWEDGQPQGYANTVQYAWNVAGYYNTSNPPPEASRITFESFTTPTMAPNGGAQYLRVAGYSQASYAYAYFRLFDTNIPISNGMKLRYWIYDYQRSTFAIDGHFTDGNTIRDFENGDRLRDQNAVRIHPSDQGSYSTGQWRYVEVDLSRAAGRTLDYIMVAYDNGNDGYTGQIRAYIDNLSIGY